ncbi:MAG: GNAT family N-acetyltransferase [Bradyrhizobium sp.]|nr:GNAT family N-acetyltransferase [Bradyrhizobium sp.]
MQITTEDLRRIERLHMRAWPAFETADIHGWLWRYSGGGSQRANSVSTVDFAGADRATALDEVEARYRARNATVRLHTYDLSAPAGIADLLQGRGYGTGETTLTMAKAVGVTTPSADVEVAATPNAQWLEVYLGAISESRRSVNARTLGAVPQPCSYFSCRRAGQVISTGLCVADGDFAVVECMATRAEARREGGADAVLRSLEAWAAERGVRILALQAVATNTAAIPLYTRFGFTSVATNRFWEN